MSFFPKLSENYFSSYCHPLQDYLDKWIPGIPNDVIWSCVKSSLYSLTLTLLITRKNYLVAGINSILLATLTVMTYAVAMFFFRKATTFSFLNPVTLQQPDTSKPEHLVISLTLVVAIIETCYFRFRFPQTFVATALPYVWGYSKGRTPLFGIICY